MMTFRCEELPAVNIHALIKPKHPVTELQLHPAVKIISSLPHRLRHGLLGRVEKWMALAAGLSLPKLEIWLLSGIRNSYKCRHK